MVFPHFELSNIEIQAIIAGLVSYLINRVLRWHDLRRESGGIVGQLRALFASLEDHCINTDATDAETHFVGVLIDEIRDCAYSAEAGKALWRSRQVSAFYDDVSSVLRGRESLSRAVDDDGRRATLALIAVRARTARARLSDHRTVLRIATAEESVTPLDRVRSLGFLISARLIVYVAVSLFVIGVIARFFEPGRWIVLLGAAAAVWPTWYLSRNVLDQFAPKARTIMQRISDRLTDWWAVAGFLALLLFSMIVTAQMMTQIEAASSSRYWIFADLMTALFAFSEAVVFVGIGLIVGLYIWLRIARDRRLRFEQGFVRDAGIDGVCRRGPGSSNVQGLNSCGCTGVECVVRRLRV